MQGTNIKKHWPPANTYPWTCAVPVFVRSGRQKKRHATNIACPCLVKGLVQHLCCTAAAAATCASESYPAGAPCCGTAVAGTHGQWSDCAARRMRRSPSTATPSSQSACGQQRPHYPANCLSEAFLLGLCRVGCAALRAQRRPAPKAPTASRDTSFLSNRSGCTMAVRRVKCASVLAQSRLASKRLRSAE